MVAVPQWQVLTHNRPRKHTSVYVRTEPSGRIGFSIEAYRQLGCPTEIEILIDRASGQVGFRPATAEARAWRVNRSTPSAAYIYCARILSLLDLCYAPQSFPATFQMGMLVIATKQMTLLTLPV